MTKKVKHNRDNSVTVVLNGRNNAAFWIAVDKEAAQWTSQGYKLVYIEKGASYFKDGILTSLLNMFRTILGMREIHDPVVKLTFAK